MNLNSTDKASIQQRMYQQAAEKYRQHLGRDISSLEMFDPLVLMIISACASEFQLFAEEISFAKTRMLKHVAKMLTPESYTGPRPAHGVLHAPVTQIGESTDRLRDSFFYNNPQGKKIYFAPVANFPLVNGRVNYIAAGNAIYEITDGLNKREVMTSSLGKSLPSTSIWIGLNISSPDQLNGPLNVYFDVPLSSFNRQLPPLLETSRSFFGEEELTTLTGLSTEQNIREESLVFNAIDQHDEEVIAFYQGKFLQIDLSSSENYSTGNTNGLSSVFTDCFAVDALDKELKDSATHWVRIDFTPSVFSQASESQSFLQLLTCQVNCFPVTNSVVQTKSFALNERINLFPLKCGEAHFYGVETVKSSQRGKYYTEMSFARFLENDAMATRQKTMVYALRRSAVQRFDTRTSIQWMENILQLIREEALVYNALGKNILTHNLKTIQKAINDITVKINLTKAEDGHEEQMFIALPRATDGEYIVVRYWVTNGAEANNVSSGEALSLSDSSRGSYDESALRLISTSLGGRNPVNEKDALEEFRSSILVKDKIVTKEDIRQYCVQECGNEVVSCQVKKSSMIAKGKRQGFQRIIAVELKVIESASEMHRQYIENKLSKELNARCTGILPIVVNTIY